jgi:hypothetical protein
LQARLGHQGETEYFDRTPWRAVARSQAEEPGPDNDLRVIGFDCLSGILPEMQPQDRVNGC